MNTPKKYFMATVAVFGLVTSLAVWAPASGLAGLVPTGTKGGGYFYTNPAAPIEQGQAVTLAAMFASSTAGKTVTFYRQLPAGDPTGDFVAFQTKAANSNGNAYIDGYVVNDAQNLFAKVDDANETEVEVLTPVPVPQSTTAVLDAPTNGGKTWTAHFGDPAVPGKATQLQIQRIYTKETNEVNEAPDTPKVGPWVTIASSTQGATGNSTFSAPSSYVYRVAHNYRAVSGTAISNTQSYGLPASTPKNSGLAALYFNTNEGHAVDTRSRYFEGEFTMTASTKGPACAAVPTVKNSIMKGRGNYSWSFPRKSYTLKLGTKLDLCGMGVGSKYALVSNDYDKSLMRNSLAGYVGKKLDHMAWTPDSTPVDLYLNGAYRGNYLLVERISIDPARVNIPELKADDGKKDCNGVVQAVGQAVNPTHPNNLEPCVTGGYVLEWDFRKGADYNAYLGSDSGYVGVKDPEFDYSREGVKTHAGISPQQQTYIKTYLNHVDDVMRGSSTTFRGPDGWRKYIDEASAVDFYIAQEYMKATDSNMWASVYMYKQRDSALGAGDGKLFMGPLWDFDLSTGSRSPGTGGQGNIVSPYYFYLKNNLKLGGDGQQSNSPTWFALLNTDPAFREAVKNRWNEIYAGFNPAGYLDTEKAVIATSASQTYSVFGHGTRISGYQVIKSDFNADVAYLRDWVNKRRSWLNGTSGFN
jgi:hypothetical protein